MDVVPERILFEELVSVSLRLLLWDSRFFLPFANLQRLRFFLRVVLCRLYLQQCQRAQVSHTPLDYV